VIYLRRWLVFLCLFLIITIIVLFVIDRQITKKKLEVKKIEEKNIIENKANQTIRVRMSKTNEIIAMDINDYLKGVVVSEMPPYYNIEALKAQAIVARTYTYRKMTDRAEGEEADICDNFNHCQVYYSNDKLISIWKNKGYNDEQIRTFLNNATEAVVKTTDLVITYNNQYIKAFFHASSPIRTEDVSQIWGCISLPYLKSVDNVELEDYANRNSTVEVKIQDFENRIKENINKNYKICDINSLKINNYTISGRVKDIKIDNLVISAEKLRIIYGLKSTNFTIEILNDRIKFNVIGYGHGIGMSQVGANYLAINGKNYQEIINHYYTNVEIKNIQEMMK
jgi:stage II sporulation protein D